MRREEEAGARQPRGNSISPLQIVNQRLQQILFLPHIMNGAEPLYCVPFFNPPFDFGDNLANSVVRNAKCASGLLQGIAAYHPVKYSFISFFLLFHKIGQDPIPAY
jgi:hypothetical protein